MGAGGDGDGYGRWSTNCLGARLVTDRNTVVERDKERIRVSANVISECAEMRRRQRKKIAQFP